MITLGPDAHSIVEIENIRWGVAIAHKDALLRSMTWNAHPLAAFEEWFE